MEVKTNSVVSLNCIRCGKDFKVSIYRKDTAKYCSRMCVGYFTYGTLAMFEELLGNPEPRRLNLLLNYTALELYDYVVSRKVQRLSVEDKEANKTLKNIVLADDVPNYALPFCLVEDDIVRHPLKDGVLCYV
jgi:hypothetical protein